MAKIFFQNTLLFLLLGLSCHGAGLSGRNTGNELQDTLREKQFLYNGRVWWNQHIKVRGHAFYLTSDFISGNVILKGKVYNDLKIKYDIFSDEIILFVNPKTIIFLNKEMVDEFNLIYENVMYTVRNFGSDSTSLINGYANVLYEGPSAFYAKFLKKIEPLAEEKKYDRFYQTQRMYIMKDSTLIPFSGRKGLYKIMEDRKKELKDFIKENRLNIMKNDPYTFIPLIRYYDSIQKKLP
jgi:hypothetical protein